MYVDFKNKKEEEIEDEFQERHDEGEGSSGRGYPRDAILHWRAPEYEIYEKDHKWYLYIGLFLSAVVGYALYKDSPVMAITFVLIGVVGYIFINKKPKIVDFGVTNDGIIAGRNIYDFDNIKSFWIFYEPEGVRVISLHMKNQIIPFIHIPVHDEDPTEIRNVLMEFLPEVKQTPSIVDSFERFLGI